MRDLMAGTLLFLLLSLVGCVRYRMPAGPELRLFDQVRVEAPFDRVDTTRESVLTTRVDPRFTGKGYISMSIRRWPPVMSPEFKLDEVFDSTMAVQFTADKTLSTPWTFQFPDRDEYQVIVTARCDSIFVADSNRYYSSGSNIVVSSIGDTISYGAINVATGNVIYLYP